MYFTRHSDGHRGARARFLFRTGAAFLQHHRRSCHSRPEKPDVACSGCSVHFEDILEGVQHRLFTCIATAAIREQFCSDLVELVGAPAFAAFSALAIGDRVVSMLRDDFVLGSSSSDSMRSVKRLCDSYFAAILDH